MDSEETKVEVGLNVGGRGASGPIRVAIADDQDLVRAGFAMVIGSQDDMEVVGQASQGEQAVDLVQRLTPDVVLMDVRMPGMDGLEATKRICQLTPSPASMGDDPCRRLTRVIILTTFDLDEYVMAAIQAGASGFLLKDTEPETLLASIRTVHQGNAIIAPSATKRLIERMAQGAYDSAGFDPQSPKRQSVTGRTGYAPSSDYRDPELNELTERELEVLAEIAHGLSNQEIANQLFISLPTVKTHVAHILQKIHARDRVQAVVFAYDNHLV
nr:response regulator transcription factor [Bifidobacterium actinocoloniiforme]